MRNFKPLFISFICFGCLFNTSIGWAEDTYPSKAIQLIFPYAAGDASDIRSRIVGEKMGQYLGQPVLVVNKTGGGASLGINFVAKSKPDGYTLLSTPSAFLIAPIVTSDPPYTINDFVPLGKLASWNRLLVVNKDFPAKNIAELVAYAKKRTKILSYTGGETGGGAHLTGQLLNLDTGIDLQFIPYPGENAAMVALLGNHVELAFLGLSRCLPHIRSGALRPMAVLSTKRDPLLPQVPTSVEQGYPNLVAPSYHIFLAPVKTPATIVKMLEGALEKALQDKQVREKIEKTQYAIDYLNSQETSALINNETKKWAALVKKLNLVIK